MTKVPVRCDVCDLVIPVNTCNRYAAEKIVVQKRLQEAVELVSFQRREGRPGRRLSQLFFVRGGAITGDLADVNSIDNGRKSQGLVALRTGGRFPPYSTPLL